MSRRICSHLKNFKERGGRNSFELVHGAFVSCIFKNSRKRKAHECFCYACNSKKPRIHVCLYCVYFGCFGEKHIHDHAVKKEHALAVDVTYGYIYCFKCGDYVYDEEFSDISLTQRKKSAKILGINRYIQWEPDSAEIYFLNENPKRRRITDKSFIGLRGLINLGNTCFMNSIIQVLIHAPLLRDFFLSDCHTCQFKDGPSMCLVCEMSKLFQEFYSGFDTPHAPYRMLYLLWTHAKHLAGYEQQDAHEFFIATLDVLHEHFKESNNNDSSHCSCIVCQIFKGKLQSDVSCQNCKNVSTKFDDIRDISLELGFSSDLTNPSDTEPMSLENCLERYTKPERLEGAACSNCHGLQEPDKQLTLKQLPLIASFHLKRFEVEVNHKPNSKYNSSQKQKITKRKLTKKVSFPPCLDMMPFLSPFRSMNISNSTNGENHFNSFRNNNNKYYLFAVVNHEGDTDSGGHYFSYIRQHRDQWFKCDDAKITRADIDEVLQSEAYLLFYHKQILEYE